MANETSVTNVIRCVNGTFVRQWAPQTIQISNAVARADQHVQVIGFAADEVITVASDVVTLGVAAFQNNDVTNYVDIGPDNSGTMLPMIRLYPGETATMRLKPGITLRAQAAVAAVPLDVFILNN